MIVLSYPMTKIKLIEFECQSGCGNTWRAMPTSINRFCGASCAYQVSRDLNHPQRSVALDFYAKAQEAMRDAREIWRDDRGDFQPYYDF